eukprot:3029691-Alexandrium_andersonii.AAC.1
MDVQGAPVGARGGPGQEIGLAGRDRPDRFLAVLPASEVRGSPSWARRDVEGPCREHPDARAPRRSRRR